MTDPAHDRDPAGTGPHHSEPASTTGRIDRRHVFDGRIVHLSVDTVRFPDGSIGELELIEHSGAAAVLPVLDSIDDPDPHVLLLRQYRYAAGGYMLEVPAGRPDRPGEEWEACARRELEEETGLVARNLLPLTTIFTTPGFTDERIHLFLAHGLSQGRSALDDDEFIEPIAMPMSHALDLIRTGEITDAKTISTLLYAECYALPGRSAHLKETRG